MTRNTIVSAEEFRKEITLIRQRGYAIDDEEHIDGIRCVAVPVKDHFGDVCAALCVVGPKHRLSMKKNQKHHKGPFLGCIKSFQKIRI